MKHRLTYWEPETLQEREQAVSTSREVEDIASELLAEYVKRWDFYPGLELENADSGSMSIAIAPFGTSLCFTDSALNQRCAVGDDNSTGRGANPTVHWGQASWVSWREFIAKDRAFDCIDEWMRNGTLSPSVQWSDDCA